jgi:hypothetical protein
MSDVKDKLKAEYSHVPILLDSGFSEKNTTINSRVRSDAASVEYMLILFQIQFYDCDVTTVLEKLPLLNRLGTVTPKPIARSQSPL